MRLAIILLLAICGCSIVFNQRASVFSPQIHIQARSNLLVGAFAWKLEDFYSAAKTPHLKPAFTDTTVTDKALISKLIGGITYLTKDDSLFLNIRVLCKVHYNKEEYLLIAFSPRHCIYIKDMKKGMFRENDGQMYRWNEDFYENIKQYIPYKYP